MSTITENPKEVRLELITSDGVITPHPCYVYSIILTGTGECPTTVNIYNGENAGGVLMLSINTFLNQSTPIVFGTPQYFSKGVYVDVGTNIGAFMIQYLLAPQK